jgi:tellurite resistance protein
MTPAPFWRRTPPALFPVCLGLLGLGLAWRRAGVTLGAPAWIGEAVLAVSAAVFLGVLASYAAKLAVRPGVVFQDLNPRPARGVNSAGSMSLMLLAAAVLPWSEPVARVVWWAGLGLHLAFMAVVALILWRSRHEGIGWSPVLFLPFVGQIVAPLAGVPLGYPELSAAILVASVPGTVLILVLSLLALRRAAPPPPARPAFVIMVTPFALIGLGAALLGWTLVSTLFFLAGLGVLAVLVLAARWLVAGGWTPGWAAFTFPVASFASLSLAAETTLPGLGAGWIGAVLLLYLSLMTPWVAWRSFRAWSAGLLGRATGAAVA